MTINNDTDRKIFVRVAEVSSNKELKFYNFAIPIPNKGDEIIIDKRIDDNSSEGVTYKVITILYNYFDNSVGINILCEKEKKGKE